MEGIAVEYLPVSFDHGNNKEKYEFNSYKSDDNEKDACNSHGNMFYIFKNMVEKGILVFGMSIVW